LAIDVNSFDCTDIGANNVVLTVTDNNGNSSTCNAIVTVEDNVDPTAVCQDITVQLDTNGNASITAAQVDGGSSDACGIQALAIDVNSFDCTDIGANNVVLTVTDNNGNSSTCNAIVTVEDNVAPIITCPTPNPSYDADPGQCYASLSFNATATDNCLGSPTITYNIGGSVITFPYNFPIGSTTVTAVANDGNGQTASCAFSVAVADNEDPTASNPAPITASGSAPAPNVAVVTDEADNCTASPIVAWVSDTPTGSCPVIVSRLYSVTDNAGNSINVTQTITVNDAIPPVANCISTTLVITLDSTTGTATLNPADLNDGSTDNCSGTLTFSASQTDFDCSDIGQQFITLTVADAQGNTDTCTAPVLIEAPTINSGTLTGYNMQTETSADADDVIEFTACPIDPVTGNTMQQDAQLDLTVNATLAGQILKWQQSIDGGLFWTDIANTSTSYTYMDVQQTTLLRAVFQIGNCLEFSPIAILAVVPPDIPPTIVNGTEFNQTCMGEDVTVIVESEFGVGSELNNGGLFNEANLNNLGWIVDGEQEMSAGGNNTNDTYWKETNGPKTFNGRCYDVRDNTKFAVVSGIPPYVNQPNDVHIITPCSTLETPIFSTLGLTSASLNFDQAYFLEAGAYIKIEISVDGGANYDTELSYTEGATQTIFDDNLPGGQCNGAISGYESYLDDAVNIDLQNYIGMTNLRIRFTYCAYNPSLSNPPAGNTGQSSWAIDNIQIPQNPVDEVIEWTDEGGVLVTTGSTVTISPNIPGVQEYGATSRINGCRSADDSGTEFITIEASLAYAGTDISPITNECGENTVALNAYDNNLTVLDNAANGTYPPPNGFLGVPVWGMPDAAASPIDHDNNPATPNRIPTNYNGTGVDGQWSVVGEPNACLTPVVYSFSNPNSPTSSFTANTAGNYTLRWTLNNGCYDDVLVVMNDCSQIDFDGVDDYITFKDNYDYTGPFSIETWVKPEDLNGIQSLISKRDEDNTNSGYELRLSGNNVEFYWGNSSISSNAIDATTWHHIAVTFNGSTYKLYLDGVEKASGNGSAPVANSIECILGAMDQSGNPPNKPVNYYHGWMDEIRFWNKALDVEHIRQMMNQEIRLSGSDDVFGEVIPLKVYGPDSAQNGTDDNPLLWSNLDGYYRMGLNCGYLTPTKGSINGRLRNINSAQEETAPLPYYSASNGDWSNANTWAQPVVWYTPNSSVNGTKIDWNIVRTSHNITSGDKDITLLGLLVDSAELTIADPVVTSPVENNNGQGLWVTHYLRLDGQIDLVGESQLVQKRYYVSGTTTQYNESILDVNSSGYLERDQQGTNNPFNYNYWGSPVGPQTIGTNNNPRNINGIMRDGTNSNNPQGINWVSTYTAPGTNPISLSTRWTYAYENYASNTYANWKKLSHTTNFNTGLGHIMKGSGNNYVVNTAGSQNYVFTGKPNNGTITTPINAGYDALVGNPYASAIDANEFINDNQSSTTGALYFWEHYVTNNTHILRDYLGGYAVRNLFTGLAAVTPAPTADGVVIAGGSGTKIPGRYVPVGQGFFVFSNATGGVVTFKNSQRVFERENSGNSVFVKSSNSKNSTPQQEENNEPQIIRFEFKTPKGAIRHLAFGFTPDNKATDGVDFGYDAITKESLPDDMLFMIDDKKFVIQAVGEFDETKEYPLGLFLSNAGEVELSITAFENIVPNIKVYIYDALLGTYSKVDDKNQKFEMTLDADVYLDRFFITFSKKKSLSVSDELLSQVQVNYLQNSKEIFIKTPLDVEVKQVYLTNILGQHVKTWNKTNTAQFSNEMKIPVGNVTYGTYIIEVQTTSGNNNKKVIIGN
ncbi:LamG-like jellyroll fold domain-containing protein, partial [Aestuariivivens marinum]|uniref:LamG-like jellyroll fold domain-containing protein n=1 Tax=Aestuariivivens marinum TaxID=2913555 RepID=UPI001F5726F7